MRPSPLETNPWPLCKEAHSPNLPISHGPELLQQLAPRAPLCPLLPSGLLQVRQPCFHSHTARATNGVFCIHNCPQGSFHALPISTQVPSHSSHPHEALATHRIDRDQHHANHPSQPPRHAFSMPHPGPLSSASIGYRTKLSQLTGSAVSTPSPAPLTRLSTAKSFSS